MKGIIFFMDRDLNVSYLFLNSAIDEASKVTGLKMNNINTTILDGKNGFKHNEKTYNNCEKSSEYYIYLTNMTYFLSKHPWDDKIGSLVFFWNGHEWIQPQLLCDRKIKKRHNLEKMYIKGDILKL